jgi:hypothetical protein
VLVVGDSLLGERGADSEPSISKFRIMPSRKRKRKGQPAPKRKNSPSSAKKRKKEKRRRLRAKIRAQGVKDFLKSHDAYVARAKPVVDEQLSQMKQAVEAGKMQTFEVELKGQVSNSGTWFDLDRRALAHRAPRLSHSRYALRSFAREIRQSTSRGQDKLRPRLQRFCAYGAVLAEFRCRRRGSAPAVPATRPSEMHVSGRRGLVG